MMKGQTKRRPTKRNAKKLKKLHKNQGKQQGSSKRLVKISQTFPKVSLPLHHGLVWDADVGQCPVPTGLGWGHHQLHTTYVEGHRLRGQHYCDRTDHLGGHLDGLCG